MLRVITWMLLLSLPQSVAAAQSHCMPADAFVAVFRDNIVQLASSPDPYYADARARAGLPLLSGADVVYVTDEVTCQKVADAIAVDARGTSWAVSGRVYVLKVGTVYIARDPGLEQGGHDITFHLSKSFRITARYRG